MSAAMGGRHIRDVVFGTASFPGRFQLSRFATKVFGLVFLKRNKLASCHNTIIGQLNDEQKAQLRQLLVSQKFLCWTDRKKYRSLPESLSHFHFCKTLTRLDIETLVTEFNRRVKSELLDTDNLGNFFIKPTDTTPLPAPLLHLQLAKILTAQSHPYELETITRQLRDAGVQFSTTDLSTHLSSLADQGLIRYTADNRPYLASREEEFLTIGQLIKVDGVTKLMIPDVVSTRRFVRILGPETGPDHKRYGSVELSSHPEYLPCLRVDGTAYIHKDVLEETNANEKLLFGLRADGSRVVVENSPASRRKHGLLLVNYEAARLTGIIDELKLPDRENILALVKNAAKLADMPEYAAYYRARKILQNGGSANLAIAAVLCDLEPAKLRLAITALGLEESKFLPAIEGYRAVRDWPFDRSALEADTRYIDKFIRGQRQAGKSLEAIKLFLVSRIAKAIYQTELMTKEDWEEARLICTPVAGQSLPYSVAALQGYDRLAEQFKDLYLMHTAPQRYIAAARKFKEATGLTRLQADAILREKVAPELKQLVCDALHLKPEDIDVYFRPKSYSSIDAKERDIRDWLGLTVVFDIKSPAAQANGSVKERNLTSLLAAKNLLIQTLLLNHNLVPIENDKPGSPANVRDCVANPRPSGYQDIKIYGLWKLATGKILGIEVITQTEEMYRRAKIAATTESYWARSVTRSTSQTFKPLSPSIATTLLNDPAKDFAIISSRDDNRTFVFVARPKNGSLLFKGDNIPTEIKLDNVTTSLAMHDDTAVLPEDLFIRAQHEARIVEDLTQLGEARIYRPTRNKEGKKVLILQNHAQGQTVQCQTGDVVVFFQPHSKSTIPNRAKRLETIASNPAHDHATRYQAWQGAAQLHRAAIPAKDRPAEIERQSTEAARHATAGKITLDRMIGAAIAGATRKRTRWNFDCKDIRAQTFSTLRYRSEKDLAIALDLGLISEETLNQGINTAINNSGEWAEIKIDPQGRKIVTLHLPEQKGILSTLSQHGLLAAENLVGLQTETTHNYGRRRTTLRIIYTAGTDINEGRIDTAIAAIKSQAKKAPAPDFGRKKRLMLGFSRADQNRWVTLQSLILEIQLMDKTNIFAVNLLPVSPDHSSYKPATVSVEIDKETWEADHEFIIASFMHLGLSVDEKFFV